MILARCVPAKFRVPVRYYYHRVLGMLEPEILFLPSIVREGGTAVDVGSFNGEYGYAMSKFASNVHCFEPQPHLARELTNYRNPKLRVHNVALGSTSGRMELNIPLSSGREFRALATLRPNPGECVRISVDVRTLDDFELRNVTVIKVDVEGYELEVLAGAQDTIARDHPVLIVEVEARHHGGSERRVREVFEEIVRLDYAGYFLDQRKLKSIEEFSVEGHQTNVLGGPNGNGYINNFIFRRA